MRSWAVVLASCWVGAACAQLPADPRLDKTVSLQLRAAPVAKIVGQIGESVGVPIQASPSMWQEILLVDVKDVKAAILLERIAERTSGQWKVIEGTLTLTRDSRAVAKDAKEDLARRTALIREELSRRKAALTAKFDPDGYVKESKAITEALQRSTGPLPDEWLSRSFALNMSQPDQRLVTRMCSLVSPNELAAIGPNERVVFSNAPNRMQRPLGSFAPAFHAYSQETVDWRETQRRLMTDGGAAAVEEAAGELPPSTPKVPVRVLMAVARSGDALAGSLSVSLTFIDSNDQPVLNAYGNLLSDGPTVPSPASYARTLTGPIEFSPETKKLNAVMRSRFAEGDEQGKVTDPEVLARLLHPEEFDPIDGACSDALLGVSRALNKNTIAVIPDSAAFFFLFAGEQNVTVGSFLDQLIAGRIIRVLVDDDWLTILPDDMTLARRMRANRAELGKFVRLASEKNALSLDETASFCAKHEDPPYASIALFTLMMVMGDRVSALGSGSWQMLSLWGKFSADQKKVLRAGGNLSLGSLTSDQVRMVYQMVYGAEGRVDLVEDTSQVSDESAMLNAFSSEPTEALPTGLLANGAISMKPAQFDLFAVKTRAESGQEVETSEMPESIAWRLFARERPDLFPWAMGQVDEDRFRLGTMTTLNFTFRFTPKVTLREDLRDASLPTSGPWLKYDQLPEAVRVKVAALVEQQRQQYSGVKAGEGGGEEKPPPVP
ncbi:MAG: hypothetical protein K1X67_18700 [Fimbriimonadaceae bacterium]|nr:hypothetical protein [Fimbriimonadaceae bacterium]